MKKIIFLIFISYSALIPCVLAADTCTVCQTTWSDSSKACSDDDTYISCLINAAATADGCDKRHEKMKEAKDHRDGIDPACTALSKTCDCQVNYHYVDVTGDTEKCAEAKKALACLIAATDDTACSGATVTARKDVVAAFKIIATTTADCALTDTCKCQAEYYSTDVTAAADKCTAGLKTGKCLKLITAKDESACDGTTSTSSYLSSTETTTTTACDKLTDTCKCQAEYDSTDVSNAANKCTALKKEMYCLASANDLACDGKKRNEIATTVDGLIVDNAETVGNCKTGLTDTCKCSIDFAKKDTTASDALCTEVKKELQCLAASKGKGCDETSERFTVATTAHKLLDADCTSGLTETCKCAIDFAKKNTSASDALCTEAKKEIHCLATANDLACDGTSKRSAIAATAEGLFDETCTTGLTDTCKCTIAYAKNATTDMCSAATGLKDCVTEITPDTVLACDGTTQTGNYLNSTITQIVQKACSGTVILLSMSVVAGYLVILFEMFLE